MLLSYIFGPSMVDYSRLSNNRSSKLHAVIDCLFLVINVVFCLFPLLFVRYSIAFPLICSHFMSSTNEYCPEEVLCNWFLWHPLTELGIKPKVRSFCLVSSYTMSLYSSMITAFLFGLSLFSAVSNRRAQSVSREYVFRFHGQGGQEYLEPGGPGTYSTQSTGQWTLNLFLHQHRTTCLFIFIYPVRSCYRNSYRSGAGAVVRALASHRWGPGSILSSVHMWAKFVVGSFSAPRGFSPGTPVFPSLQKPALLNSNSTRNARTLNTWASGSGEGATTPRVIELKQLIWFDFDLIW